MVRGADWRRRAAAGILVAAIVAQATGARAAGLAALWHGLRWGGSSRGLLAHFGSHAAVLPWPIDFGDSYAEVVLRGVPVGGVPLIAFFQMDKTTGGLKRIQLERPRHGVNPPAFRDVLSGLGADFGAPFATCGARPTPANGYQAAAEQVWRRDGVVIRAIFRDTTIEAFEGCLVGAPPCGLTGQLLIRIDPRSAAVARCGG